MSFEVWYLQSRHETIEARSTKWNFDVELDSGTPRPTLEPRRDEGMPTAAAPIEIPTVPPPAPPPEAHEPEIRTESVQHDDDNISENAPLSSNHHTSETTATQCSQLT